MTCVVARIGAGAGFAGDRVEPAVVLAASGQIDTVALECLAERTLLPAIKARAADPSAGYDPRLKRRFDRLLPAAYANHCRIVSNIGQANPLAAGEAIARLARDLSCTNTRVAAVIGDDVMPMREHVEWVRPLPGRLIGAHAYLGAEPLAEALESGATVVVSGRVADAALFAAPALHHLDSSQDALAGTLAVGHLMECSGQLSGGNFAPVGGSLLSAVAYADLGYPMATISDDGNGEISLLDGAHGVLTPETCTLQLLYEVHDPARYITPDVTLDFSAVEFEQIGPNRVRMSGARGLGRPQRLKVAGFMELPGFIADCEIGFSGTQSLMRAQRTAEALQMRLHEWDEEDVAIDLVGVNSILRAGSLPMHAQPPEVRVHVSARCASLEAAQIVEDEVYAMTLCGPAGGSCIRSERRARIEVVDGFIARERVQARIEWSKA